MDAATTVVLSQTDCWVLGFIAAYAIGAYVSAVLCGIGDGDGETAILFAVFWPFALVTLGALAVINWLSDPQRISRPIAKALDWATLPLRPLALGKRIRGWWNAWLRRRRAK